MKGNKEECSDESSSAEEDTSEMPPVEGAPPVEGNNGAAINTILGPIYEYDAQPENIPQHPSVVSFGQRRSGKSTSMDNFFFHCIQDVPFGICITRTKKNGFWQQRIPERFVFQASEGIRGDLLAALLERQGEMIKKHGKENPITFAFCILDDIIADQNAIRHTTALNSFFVEGRHNNISVFITSQQIKGIGPMVRNNCDLAFLQPIYNVVERQSLWEMYAGFVDKKSWYVLMDEIIYSKKKPGHTPLHPDLEVQIMVVQTFDQTPHAHEKFFWWKPVRSEQLKYKLLDPIYWKHTETALDGGSGGNNKGRPAHPADALDNCRSVLTREITI